MEKIQSAIAKARADRAAARSQEDPGAAEPPVAVPTYAPAVQHSTRVALRSES